MNKQTPSFYYFFLLYAAIFLFQSSLYAQSVTRTYNFPKFEILQYENNGTQIKLLTFENAITTYEFPTLPALWDKIEVNNLYPDYHYVLSNIKYGSLTPEEIALIPPEYVFNEPKVDIKTATDRKFYAMLSIIPIVKNANGQYQRLVSCDITFEGTNPIYLSKAKSLRNSVLATGTWYKIAVNNTGLYKVTYNDLKSLGIPVSGLRSSSIALFGNGGGQLPEINPVELTDDIKECPIMIVNDEDGVFNEKSYFVFYAQGPHTWNYNANAKFTHNYNIYSDNAYYFINVDPGIGEKKRIGTKDFSMNQENGVITSFTHYDFYENDVKNFVESGRAWLGDIFYAGSSKTYNFTLPELSDSIVAVKIRVAATSPVSSQMELSWGNKSRTFNVNGSSNYASITEYSQNLPLSSGNLALTLKYNSSQNSSSLYLDYIEIQAKCKLSISNAAMPFAIIENIGANRISLVNLANASAQTIIWDVTDHNEVYALKGALSGTRFSFKTPTDQMRRFIAFNGTVYNTVTTLGKVANQNLHGFKGVDMVIVAHPAFLSEAKRLADFRAEEKITVKVVTPEQVYNEFSSGAQDVVAIRNFMRYLYDNDSQTLKYLLLFGRPSYDYRGRVAGTQLFVPNYQCIISDGYLFEEQEANDDFFGVLGALNQSLINIAVGRFPVSTLAHAKIAVDKTINASVRSKIATQNVSQIPNFGDWRNVLTFVAENYDKGAHVKNAEASAKTVASNYLDFNLDKIYCDAYPAVSYAGGKRYPDVNNAIKMRMERGTLAISYFGHGGGNGWANARILEISDIKNWTNKYNQPLMITLTCSFGWYDKPATSPAELVFLNENGGACALITTSRNTGPNQTYGKYIFLEMGSKQNGRYKTVGEIQRNAKNSAGGLNSEAKVIYLIGDPAMRINIPDQNVITDEILGEDLNKTDTIKALSKVTVKGRVTDNDGKILTDFNGNIYPSIFDKVVKQKTLGQDAEIIEYDVQKNVIFKGNATVTNGRFEFSFIVPKDINYEYGNGKISYYAASANDDAGGYFNNFMIGGMSDKPIADNKGPEIRLFLNDEKFVSGGITNQNPVIVMKLKDEYGINTTGNGIGHDIVAILNNNVEKQIVLNDYYVAEQNSYNSGTVRYQLQNLEPGMHTLKVRAWDICNNPSETSIDFEVKSDTKLELAHVLNYPNPFTTSTKFYFEQNQPGETFDILLHIFTISGKLVKTFQRTLFLEGNRSEPIEWDGRDEYGDKIGKGVYLYRLTVRNSQGKTAEKIEKITIL